MSSYTEVNQFVQTNKQLGGFSSYVRRPVPQLSGMIAQFFGPNGEDSDNILALSLSKFVDAEVLVNVYMIKDSNGVVIKGYPKIAQFFAIIRRGKPARGGMVAELFAVNGKDSDAVNELGKSQYLDCLVYIEIYGKLAKPEDLLSPVDLIDKDYVSKVSQHEIKEYKKNLKSFEKINKKLYNGFLKQPNVWEKLGTPEEFNTYLSSIGCCIQHRNPPCVEPSTNNLKLTDMPHKYNFLCFCDEHLEEINNSLAKKDIDTERYLNMKHSLEIQNWGMHQLQKKFSLTGKESPDSKKIAIWAKENEIDKTLPEDFKNLL